jgi:DNA-binding IclR family transcriptional regulator
MAERHQSDNETLGPNSTAGDSQAKPDIVDSAANLPRSTAHRLASELVAWRLLERTEERSYRIGLPLRMIGSAYSKSGVGS